MRCDLGFKFSLAGGKLAPASGLLLLMADHLNIDACIMVETCAMWMVSDLLGKSHIATHNLNLAVSYGLTKYGSSTLIESELYSVELKGLN